MSDRRCGTCSFWGSVERKGYRYCTYDLSGVPHIIWPMETRECEGVNCPLWQLKEPAQRCKTCRHFRAWSEDDPYAGTRYEKGHCLDPQWEGFRDVDEVMTNALNGSECQGWQGKDNKETDK